MPFRHFHHSNAWVTYVDLAVKIGQGHPGVMIYINFVELLLLLMLQTKFKHHRPSGSGEDFSMFLLFIAMVAILVM